MNKKTLVFFGVTILGVVLDQLTKLWIVANIEYRYGEIQIIDGFFSLVHAQNPGAAMGMFRDMEYRQYLFLGFTVVAVGVILDLWRKLPSNEGFLSFTMGLILSGAIGNAIDRVMKGEVTDFLRVYTEHPSLAPWLRQTFGTAEWPSFNVADSALVVGVCLFLLHYLFLEEKEPAVGSGDPKPNAPAPGDPGAPGGPVGG